MARKKLEIKMRRDYKPAVIKKRPPKIKKREKKYIRNCSYCSHWWAGPVVQRASGCSEPRICPATGETLPNNHKTVCSHYADGWVVCPKVNQRTVRDENSPPQIKRRKKKVEKSSEARLPVFTVERRVVE